MNMSAALLTLSHYEAEEVRTSNFLDDINKTIQVKVSRTGLQAGEAKITLKPQNNNVTVIDANRIVSLDLGKDTILTFHVGLNSGQRYEDGFSFDLTISNGGLERTKSIRKAGPNFHLAPSLKIGTMTKPLPIYRMGPG